MYLCSFDFAFIDVKDIGCKKNVKRKFFILRENKLVENNFFWLLIYVAYLEVKSKRSLALKVSIS